MCVRVRVCVVRTRTCVCVCVCAHVCYVGGYVLCRQGDSALLLPSNQQVIHECLVEHVGKEKIVLKITDKAKQAR